MIKVYDQSGNMLAVLEYADAIGYTLTHNDLWTATFRLPSSDPKKAFCQMHNLVSIDDGPRNIGLYRIIGTPNDDVTDQVGYTEYTCEHAAATLLDDVLFGYHEIGGGSVRTEEVIRYILARQETARWQMGLCEFTDHFVYKFENVTLLSALLSLGEVLTEPYSWEFDTTTSPWTVNLRRADVTADCGIYYARNLQQITKTVDASTLVTRLYLLGYGEGVNQLTIKAVNGGVPYIDADTISVYGVKASIFCDQRFEHAEALMARGKTLLESLKIPYITYTAKAADLVQQTGDPWDVFMPGKVVHVMDGEDGVEFEARIVTVSKSDVGGCSGDLELTIANGVRDIADSINTLADRMGINELYSQGATNLYSQQYADNADAAHPARMRVYVPSGCVRINQMLLSWRLDAFRAYSTGAAAGGGTLATTASGGASTQTSSAGGASERTSQSGGAYAKTLAQRVVSTEAVTGGTISGHSGDTSGNTGGAIDLSGTAVSYTGKNGTHRHPLSQHSHDFSDTYSLAWGHQHSYGSIGDGGNTGGVLSYSNKTISISGTTSYSGAGETSDSGSHNHSMAHKHNFSHMHNVTVTLTIPAQDITIPAHSHVFETNDHTHRVSVPEHSHDLSLSDHTHGIQYGIYEGGSASRVRLKVDGIAVPDASLTGGELDIVRYLAKDDAGKITRGTWHEIELVPDGLTRIEANLFVQTFVQSVGGGDY